MQSYTLLSRENSDTSNNYVDAICLGRVNELSYYAYPIATTDCFVCKEGPNLHREGIYWIDKNRIQHFTLQIQVPKGW